MNIIYTANPLFTQIELSDAEKSALWLHIRNEKLQERLYDVSYYLMDSQDENLESARKYADTSYFDEDIEDGKSQLDKECDITHGYYIEALTDKHCGDCMCIACSCIKCQTESLLGIDTIPGLRKHAAHNIMSAFDFDNKKSIDEALESLKHFHIDPAKYDTKYWKDAGGYEQYIPKWKAEQEEAYLWLKHYKEQHFKG